MHSKSSSKPGHRPGLADIESMRGSQKTFGSRNCKAFRRYASTCPHVAPAITRPRKMTGETYSMAAPRHTPDGVCRGPPAAIKTQQYRGLYPSASSSQATLGIPDILPLEYIETVSLPLGRGVSEYWFTPRRRTSGLPPTGASLRARELLFE